MRASLAPPRMLVLSPSIGAGYSAILSLGSPQQELQRKPFQKSLPGRWAGLSWSTHTFHREDLHKTGINFDNYDEILWKFLEMVAPSLSMFTLPKPFLRISSLTINLAGTPNLYSCPKQFHCKRWTRPHGLCSNR
jgi:hypothetical protein